MYVYYHPPDNNDVSYVYKHRDDELLTFVFYVPTHKNRRKLKIKGCKST